MDYKNVYQENVEAATPEQIIKSARKDFSKLGFRILFGVLIILAVVTVAQLILMRVKPEVYDDYTMTLLASLVPQYLLGMPALVAFLLPLPHKAPEKKKVTFGWCVIFFIISYSLMMTANYIGTLLSTIISAITGVGSNTYMMMNMVENANPWVIFVSAVIIAPIAEELVFRKLIVDRCSNYGEAASALVSGVVFAFFHGNFIQGIYAFVLGYFFALIYSKTGKIYVSMGIHAVINFLGSVVAVKLLDIMNYNEFSAALNNPEKLTAYISNNKTGVMVYLVYASVVMGIFVAGIVLLIVNRRKFIPAPGSIRLPRKSTFKTAIVNPGMLVFCGIMFAYCVLNFIAS